MTLPVTDKGLFFFFQLPSVNRVLRLQQDHLSNQANPDLQQESGPSLQTAPLLEMHPDSPIPIQCLDSYLRAIDKKLKLLSDATMVVGTMKDMETESAGTITIRGIVKGGPGSSNIWNNLNKCVLYRCTIKVIVCCSWWCTGWDLRVLVSL